ncbi:hypothetical protein E4H04_11085, partial [Candidatus Bathyarchaeota archaeon]
MSIPIENARIDIYDEEIIQYPITGWGHLPWPDVFLGTVYTDDNGYFTFTVNNDDGSTILGDEKGRDIYLKVRASNGAATVRNNPDWMFGSVYEYKAGTYADLADGEDLNIPLHPDTPSYQVAFELLSNIYKARNFVRVETNIAPAKVNVFYKDSFHTDDLRSYYLPDSIGDYLATVPSPSLPSEYFPSELIDLLMGLGEIGPIQRGLIRDVAGIHYSEDILADSTKYYEVIYHEYGHHVMSELFDIGPPFPAAGPHYVDEEYHPMHAWIEGWAEFFSAAAREHLGIPNYLTFGGSVNIESLGYDYEDDPKAWDSVEGNIAGILWDIHDTENEYFDGLSLSFNDIVSIIQSYDPVPGDDKTWPMWADHPWTIYHVFDAFRPYYNYDQLTSKLWNILLKSGIEIPDTVPPQNPTSYTSSHNSVIPLNQAVIKVDMQGAYDSISGVKQYYYSWFPYIPSGINDPDLIDNIDVYWDSQTSSHFEYNTTFYGDEWYLYVITRDFAGNFAEEVFQAGPFKIHELNTLQIDGIFSTSIGEIFGNSFTQVTV